MHAAEEIEPGTIGRGVGEVIAVTGEDERAALRGLAGQVVSQGGLADARLATDEHEATMAADGGCQLFAQKDLLAAAPDEWRGRSPGMIGAFHLLRHGHNLLLLVAPVRAVVDPQGALLFCAENHRRLSATIVTPRWRFQSDRLQERHGVSEREPVTGE